MRASSAWPSTTVAHDGAFRARAQGHRARCCDSWWTRALLMRSGPRRGLRAAGMDRRRRGRRQRRRLGVDQSWSFAKAPSGQNDLRIELGASGLDYVQETDKGTTLRRRMSRGIRYGIATWIDAAGKRTIVRETFSGGTITLTVPASLVAASAYPAMLDPIVSPEFGNGRAGHLGFMPGPADGSRRRCDSTGRTTSLTRSTPGRPPGSVYATRISPTGTVLDMVGIPITGILIRLAQD